MVICFFLKKENHSNYNKYICKNKLKEKIFLVGNGENLLEKDKIISKVDTSKIFSPIYYLNISNKIKKNSWYWPTTGKIIDSYSNSEGGNKGIDISGMFNQPIVATRNGVVMYVGNLLQGYGNLIIIRHSNEYLSAYAHNNKILVFEKQKVMAGEKIATMGNSGTNLVKLHFEIRYKGKSVDPLRYLPSLGLKS